MPQWFADAEELKAERTGFEPAVGCDTYTDLANRRYRPLSHLSGGKIRGRESPFLDEGEIMPRKSPEGKSIERLFWFASFCQPPRPTCDPRRFTEDNGVLLRSIRELLPCSASSPSRFSALPAPPASLGSRSRRSPSIPRIRTTSAVGSGVDVGAG